MDQEAKRKPRRENCDRIVYTVPEAGAMVGLSRNSSYGAARRGEIPTERFGKLLVVPKVAWHRKLGLA